MQKMQKKKHFQSPCAVSGIQNNFNPTRNSGSARRNAPNSVHGGEIRDIKCKTGQPIATVPHLFVLQPPPSLTTYHSLQRHQHQDERHHHSLCFHSHHCLYHSYPDHCLVLTTASLPLPPSLRWWLGHSRHCTARPSTIDAV